MPRHDRFDDDTMMRDRHENRQGGYEPRDRGSFFDRDRDRGQRGFEDDRNDRNRPIGGWGGLMNEDRDRDRSRDRFRDDDRNRFRGEDRDRSRGEDRRFGPDDNNRGVPMDETEKLIASNKVEGTPVYDRHGDKLGSIHNFMVDKTKGHVAYAVLKHGGGFLGLNERYYPLEWDQLDYDMKLGGYHTRLDEDDLKSFGSFDSDGRWQRGGRSDRDRGRDNRRESRRDRSDRGIW